MASIPDALAAATQALLRKDFGLPASADTAAYLSEEEVVRWLADAIDYEMQHRMKYLMSRCYVLDVPEAAVADAFHPDAPEPANVGLARLLYTRQRQRAHTKLTIKPQPLDDELAW